MIKIKSKNDLKDFIDESLMIFTFLSYLKSHEKLQSYFPTPIDIKKDESPDFVITDQVKSTGIEISSGSPKNMNYASSIIKEFPENSLIELDPDLFNQKDLNRDEIKSYIKCPKEKLTGYGWNGYGIEHSWSNNIITLIKHKTLKLNTNYSIYEKNILLINGDFLLTRKYDIANDYLENALKKIELGKDYETLFDEIFIISKVRNAVLFNL